DAAGDALRERAPCARAARSSRPGAIAGSAPLVRGIRALRIARADAEGAPQAAPCRRNRARDRGLRGCALVRARATLLSGAYRARVLLRPGGGSRSAFFVSADRAAK